MKVAQIYNLIDKIAKFSSAMSFDNVGLLVGNMENEVKKIMFCLDITTDVVEEATEKNIDLIISHHPVIFDAVKSFNGKLYKIASAGINAICCHTNLDMCPEIGVNRALADSLGFKNIYIPEGTEYFEFQLEEEMTVESFAKHIKSIYKDSTLQYSNFDKKIKTVAMCSGSGSGCMPTLLDNVDAFLTGEIKHDLWLSSKERNIAVFAFGHYDTEKIYIPYMEKYLKENTENIEFMTSENEKNPIRYL